MPLITAYIVIFHKQNITEKRTFRVKRIIGKKLNKRKQKIRKRTKKRNWKEQLLPILQASNIHYEMDGRYQGIAHGGIGAIHLLAQKIGLIDEIMDISYKGIWGYAPLIISLNKTREPLYIVNRPGNAPSHLGSAQWIDKALDLVSPTFDKVILRGDTDFNLTTNFDKWDERCTFIFGMDAQKKT